MMSSTVATSSQTRSALRDPVLLVPAVVGAGLAVGWLGTDAGVSGTRVAADLALAWALVAASLVALERARWRRSRVLLAAAAFALLGADLQLGELARPVDARLPARRAVGGAPRPGRADVSRGACLVACRPGRDRRRICGNVRRSARRRLRASRLAGRALHHVAADRGRRRRPSAGSPGHCRRSDSPLPARGPFARSARTRTARAGAAAGCRLPHRSRDSALAGLGERDRRRRPDAGDDRPGVSLLVPLGVVAGIVWSRLHRRGGVRPRRRATNRGGDQPARASRSGARRPDARGCVPPRRRPLRRRRRPSRSSSRRAGSGGHAGDRPRRRSRGARSRSGIAR